MLPAAGPLENEADDDVRANGADHPDVVAENLLLAPLLEGLVDAERVAEIHRPGEVLFGAVEAMRGEQLLRSQDRQSLEHLGADLVLPAFAARRRHQRRAEAVAVRVEREHRVVLIVGMRRRHHEVADGV